jgi:hypothetical protein
LTESLTLFSLSCLCFWSRLGTFGVFACGIFAFAEERHKSSHGFNKQTITKGKGQQQRICTCALLAIAKDGTCDGKDKT